MNRNSERAVNRAILNLVDVMQDSDEMSVVNDAAMNIKILQETLLLSEQQRKGEKSNE